LKDRLSYDALAAELKKEKKKSRRDQFGTEVVPPFAD
jgi:hypothetical protein